LGKPSTWYKATVHSSLQQQYNKEFIPGAIKANNNSLVNRYHWFVACCHELLKPSPYYVTIESTLQFDDIGVVPGFLPHLWVVQRSPMQSRKWSRRRPGN